ncbi:MAG: hypothetical protein R6U36_05310 [Candidatus Fermentibacteraceae bacterium]
MRIYWGKKILECTSSPQEALDRILALNDRWEPDGRDPGGCGGALRGWASTTGPGRRGRWRQGAVDEPGGTGAEV